MSNLLKKDKGFTLIEIVLVLAIAGLIMVIVFLAVSGAQKSRRDTQRKNDIGRIAAALENYASNNSGAYPATLALANTGLASYLVGSNYNDPLTGTVYGTSTAGSATNSVVFTAGTAAPSGTAAATVSYTPNFGGSSRQYQVCIGLEQGAQSCRTNQ